MKTIIFGATGMVGQGVLRECLLDPAVEAVLTIGRSTTGHQSQRLREIVVPDLFDLSGVEAQLSGYDACFFCLGVSAVGMSGQEYRQITFELTISVARTLLKLNPSMTFLYVSGVGTDSTERGGSMWARVKGQTENTLLKMPFKAAYMFRPGYIQPLHGIKTKTRWYGALYAVVSSLYPLLKRLFPNQVTTTQELGRAMIAAAKQASAKRIVESGEIRAFL